MTSFRRTRAARGIPRAKDLGNEDGGSHSDLTMLVVS